MHYGPQKVKEHSSVDLWSIPMTNSDRNFDDDTFDEVEEHLRGQDPNEEGCAYFPPEDSQPPHY